MQHLLDLASLSVAEIEQLLARTAYYADGGVASANLRGKCVVNLFYENSTRTRLSFELAAKRLGLEVINLDIAASSVKKGETLADTVRTINAMGVDALIIRHDTNRVPHQAAALVDGAVINAGDGTHEHPTQGLLDAFTLSQHRDVRGLVVAICGDIRHSRVAHSNIHALTKLGAVVRLIGPTPFLPTDSALPACEQFTDMAKGLQGVDAIMMLRIQFERLTDQPQPNVTDYQAAYCLDRAKLALAKPNVVVLHPGPMNRMVEIADDVADDKQHSLILTQVRNGVFARMAVLEVILNR